MSNENLGEWRGNASIEGAAGTIADQWRRHQLRCEVGPPHATAAKTAEELVRQGLRGIYVIVDAEDAA